MARYKKAKAPDTAATASGAELDVSDNIITEDDSTDSEKSQAEKRSTVKSGATRTRVFAILVYEDSAPIDWRERLVQQHVAAFISPYHDKDKDPDGSGKKPHWHVLVMFDGVKSQAQVDAFWDSVLGPDRVKLYENVNSTRGYARYLCHMDNPEKAPYSKDDVIALGGADYEEVISLPSDDYAVLDEIFEYLEESNHRYYSEFMRFCRRERRDWWKLLAKRYSYMVISWFTAERFRRRDAEEDRRWAETQAEIERTYPARHRINEETGELEEWSDANDSED